MRLRREPTRTITTRFVPQRPGVVLLVLALLVLGLGTGGKKKSVHESRATAHYKLGMRYYQNADFRGAVSEFTQAVDLVPKDPAYRVMLGQAYFAVGSLKPAEEQFLRALKLNPMDNDVHNYLGTVYSEMQDYAAAEDHFLRALEDPAYLTPEKVYLNWAMMLRKTGDLEGAERMLRKAITVSPRYVMARYRLGETLAEMGKLEPALAEYLRAWEAMPKVPELNLAIGEIYMDLGDPSQAQIYLEKVIVTAPDSDEAGTARSLLEGMPSR